MPSFKDSKGREWLAPVSVVAIERAKETSGVNICDVSRGELYDRLYFDCHLVARILLGLCKPQLVDRSVSDQEFLGAVEGEAIESGRQAILQGLLDFFPRRLQKKVQAMIDLEKTLEAGNEKRMAAFLSSVTSSQASPESNQTTAPSDN